METLEELKNTYKKLQEESNNLYSKIKALEKRNAISKFTVGDCYLNTKWDNLIKIVSIKDNYIYYICLDKDCITRDYSYIYDNETWENNIRKNPGRHLIKQHGEVYTNYGVPFSVDDDRVDSHTELFWKGIHSEEEIVNLIKNDSFLSKQFKLNNDK